MCDRRNKIGKKDIVLMQSWGKQKGTNTQTKKILIIHIGDGCALTCSLADEFELIKTFAFESKSN